MMSARWTFFGSVVVLTNCSTPHQEPRTLATAEAARCGGETTTAASVLGPANVERVEPLYGIVYSTPNGQESRLLGAKLFLHAVNGVTTEALTHALYCRAANEVLHGGEVSPYWIPDGWLDITVKYEGDSYVVHLEGHDVGEGNEILARARAFLRK